MGSGVRMSLVVLMSAGALGGCASRVPIRYAGPMPVEPANWSAVLPGEAIAVAHHDEAGRLAALTRRDDALGLRRQTPTALAGSWPRDDRPSLDNARRLFIPTTPGSVLYIGQPRDRWLWR